MKRLFDVIEHQQTHFPKQDMLASKKDGKWIGWNTKAVQNTIKLQNFVLGCITRL